MAAVQKWLAPFKEITSKPHTKQAKYWLNGFWESGAKDYAEDVWNFVSLMQETETGQKKLYGKRKVEVAEGCDLDEHKAHVFLEKLGETLTVQALRKRLKELDVDLNKRMSLVEYLLCKYKKTPLELVNSPQGGSASAKQIEAAQLQVKAAQSSVEAVNAALEESDKALKVATASAKAAAEAVEKMKAAEVELKAAEDALRAAVAEVNAQEEAYKKKMTSLEAIASDETAGAVKKNKAANELAQMKSEDPLPLRRAKITQEAALKRAEKARKPFAEATAKAEEEKVKAAQAQVDAENRKKELEKAVKKAEAELAEAQKTLDELIKAGGDSMGDLWWMDREMKEMRKFMPGYKP
jgi:chromosome segregation ATPase